MNTGQSDPRNSESESSILQTIPSPADTNTKVSVVLYESIFEGCGGVKVWYTRDPQFNWLHLTELIVVIFVNCISWSVNLYFIWTINCVYYVPGARYTGFQYYKANKQRIVWVII